METTEAKTLIRGIKEVRDELHGLNKIQSEQSKIIAKLLHPAFKPVEEPASPDHVVKTDIPVTIDWDYLPILASATVYRFEDGHVTIEIRVSPEDADKVIVLVDAQPVEALLVSSVVNEGGTDGQ